MSSSYRSGDVVEIHVQFFKLDSGRYAQAKVTAVSRSTGGLTLELVEDCGLYEKGSKLNLMPYEVMPARKQL